MSVKVDGTGWRCISSASDADIKQDPNDGKESIRRDNILRSAVNSGIYFASLSFHKAEDIENSQNVRREVLEQFEPMHSHKGKW
jgi:hypothetical protein